MTDTPAPSEGMDLLAAAMRKVHREAVEGAGEPLQRREDTSATEARSEQAEGAD